MSPKATKGVAVVLCVTVLALPTFGFVMLTSTSAFYAGRVHGDAFYFAKRQALWLGLGLAAGVATAHVDYRRYRRLAWPLFLAAAALLLGVLILGKPINGATRWLVFGPVRFQPSEFGKFALVVMLAFWLEQMQRAAPGQTRPRIQHWWWGVFAPLVLTGGLAALIVLEPDLGATLLLGAVALLLMWLAGSPRRWLTGIVGVGAAGAGALWVAIFKYGMCHEHYQVRRILDWWWETDRHGSNYQQHVAKLAFGSGGPWVWAWATAG